MTTQGTPLVARETPVDFEFRFRLSDDAKAKIKVIEDNHRRAHQTAHLFWFD